MIRFQYEPALSVPYAAVQVGSDVLIIVGYAVARDLEPSMCEHLMNTVLAEISTPPDPAKTVPEGAIVIDIDSLRERREIRKVGYS